MGVVSVACSTGTTLPLLPLGKLADTGELTTLLDEDVEAGSVSDRIPSKNWPNRCVNMWGAVLPLLLSSLLAVRAKVARAPEEGRAAAARFTESI